MDAPITDPYRTCEAGPCNHDLGRAVGIAELWGVDGPYPPGHVVVMLDRVRATVMDDADQPATQQRWAV